MDEVNQVLETPNTLSLMANGSAICETILGTDEELREKTNAPSPIFVMVEGSTTFERLSHHRKAL